MEGFGFSWGDFYPIVCFILFARQESTYFFCFEFVIEMLGERVYDDTMISKDSGGFLNLLFVFIKDRAQGKH